MRYVIFDTETTDLKGEVIQLSYMLLDSNFEVLEFDSFYCDTNAKISQGAFNVHGISNQLLEVISEGKYLEDHLLKDHNKKSIFIDGSGLVFVGYNVKFDIERVNQTLLPTGKSLVSMFDTESTVNLKESFNYSLDLMKLVKKELRLSRFVKLCDVTEWYTKKKIPEIDLDSVYEIYKEKYKLKTRGGTFHDASYDVFCTYMLLLALNL